MKTLLVLLVLSAALAAGYWKTRNPDGGIDEFRTQLAATGARLQGGFEAVRDGGEAAQSRQADLLARLEALENAPPPQGEPDTTVIDGRLTDAERRLDAAERRFDALAADAVSGDAPAPNDAEPASDSLQGEIDVLRDSSQATLSRLDSSDEALAALSARFDALEERLGQTAPDADASAETQSRLDRTDESLTALGDRLDSLQETLSERLDAMQNAATVRQDNDDARLAELASRVQAAEGQGQLLTRRLDEQTTDSEVETLTARIDTMQGTLESQNETADSQRAELASRLTGLDEKTALLETRFGTLTGDMTGGAAGDTATVTALVDQRLAQIEEKLDTTNTDSRRLDALAERLDTARKKIAQLEAEAGDAEASQQALQAEIDALKTANESLSIDQVQSSIQQQLAELRTDMETSQANAESTTAADKGTEFAQLDEALNASRERIQALEQRLLNLPASSSEASDAQQMQSLLQTQIAELEKRLSEATPATDPALVDTLTEVREQVSELASRAYVTEEDLQARQQGKSVEYKIYFERNSTSISEAAAQVLNSFITQEKNRATGVSIFGFTDRRGPAEYNQQLALQRANNVRAYLLQNGFDFALIDNVTGLGEDAAAAQLEDGAEDAQQRTVVLFARQR